MSEITINDWVTDLRLNANRLDSIVEAVEKELAAGDVYAAALVLGMEMGKIGHFRASYLGLQQQLRDEGAGTMRRLESSVLS